MFLNVANFLIIFFQSKFLNLNKVSYLAKFLTFLHLSKFLRHLIILLRSTVLLVQLFLFTFIESCSWLEQFFKFKVGEVEILLKP